MKLDLSTLKEPGSRKTLKKQIKLPDLNFREQIIETPYFFNVSLTIFNTRDSYIIKGEFKGEIVLQCSRCLDKFDYKIKLKMDNEILKKDVNDPEMIDITNIFVENILLSIPIKVICKKNCKGLCPVCGKNLNKDNCDCKSETIDPRLV
ncbi:MAG TPA: DUF177 domain-containing protein, partial [Halanaerobiales bacterium]|nr:DUF177 domain-containing protein [Halanaerobiales bacterium]